MALNMILHSTLREYFELADLAKKPTLDHSWCPLFRQWLEQKTTEKLIVVKVPAAAAEIADAGSKLPSIGGCDAEGWGAESCCWNAAIAASDGWPPPPAVFGEPPAAAWLPPPPLVGMKQPPPKAAPLPIAAAGKKLLPP